MRKKYLINFVLSKTLLLISLSTYSAESEAIHGVVSGKVTSFRSDRKEYAVVGKVLKIYYCNNCNDVYSADSKTDDEGRFSLKISNEHPIKKGEKIKIKIDDRDYFILEPYNGEVNAPNSLTNYQLPITVIANNSKMQVGQFNAHFINDDIIKSQDNQKYSIQVLSTSSEEKALKEVSILKSNNYDAFTKSYLDFNDKTVHKVFIATFSSWGDANKYKRAIRKIFKRRYKEAFIQTIVVDKI